jgi:glycerate-2-kinase
VRVIAAGKAAWPMAVAFSDLEIELARGVVAGPRTASFATKPFEWFDAGHPLPNDASVDAARLALELARQTDADDWLVVLLSGGASAMLAAPAAGLSLADKIETTKAMMTAGLPIDALNCVRKHVSSVKGGWLAAAAARSLTLALSDVHGPIPDDPSVIGSGPTVADPTSFADAVRMLRDVPGIPARVRQHLETGIAGAIPETIKPGDLRLREAHHQVIGNSRTALEGARRVASSLGYVVNVVEEPTRGEARVASREFVARARQVAAEGVRPVCVLAAGETTVHVTGRGRGGRNQEFALAGTPALGTIGRAALLVSAGTDGTDGPTDAAGALVDSSTLERSARAGVDWESRLADNDAYHFFEPLGDLIEWGPTGTNVGDLHALLIA